MTFKSTRRCRKKNEGCVVTMFYTGRELAIQLRIGQVYLHTDTFPPFGR